MKFDDILSEIGEFGRYQTRVYALVCLIVFQNSWVVLIQVFAMGGTDHWCKVPEWNITECQSLGYDAAACEDGTLMKRAYIPLVVQQNGSDVSTAREYQSCNRFNTTDLSELLALVDSNDTMVTYSSVGNGSSYTEPRGIMSCDAGWEYDRSVYTRTVIQEQNLVCGREYYIQIPQSVFYGGYLVGSLVFGVLADTIGRHKSLFICLVLNVVAGFAHLIFHSYWAFVVIRFFQGLANLPTFIISFVMGTEFVGPSKRNLAGIFLNIPFAMGYMAMAGIAYFIRDWRHLNIALTSPRIALFFVMIWLPESARWLLSQGETKKARKILDKAAEVNNVVLSDLHFEDDTPLEKHDDTSKDNSSKRNPTALDIFKHRNMRFRTFILMYLWSVCAVVYHGFNLSTSTLGINLYISFLVSAATEIPAYAISIVLIEWRWLGRRFSTVLCLLLGGVACLCTSFIAPGPARAAFGMVGKFGITAAFGIVYLYTAELYPTPLRAVGVGLCSMAGRVANILAPLILLTSKYWDPAPLVIFGSATVLAGVLAALLPETRGRKLPETVQEGEMFGRKTETVVNAGPNFNDTHKI